MKTHYVIILAVMAAAVSCAKEPLMETSGAEDGKIFKIELRASTSSKGTRITESEDEHAGLRTAWEAGEKIKAMYFKDGNASIAELVSNSGGNLFTGEVESGDDAQAFTSA